MRIPISCMECTLEAINAEQVEDDAVLARGETPPSRSPARPLKAEDWYLADIEEDNAYVEKCRNNHTVKVTLQSVRYELLFESGMVATLVGFHREAVSSLAAALERFFEFAIEVFSFRGGIEPTVQEDAWIHVRKQSERQLGAFLYLYLLNRRKPFLTGKALRTYEDWSSFRNGVIHQGVFPSPARVLEYASYVFTLIVDTRAELQELDAASLQRVELLHLRRGHAAIEAKAGPPQKGQDGLYRSPTSSALPMMLNSVFRGVPADFDARFAAAKENLWLWGFPTQRRSPA